MKFFDLCTNIGWLWKLFSPLQKRKSYYTILFTLVGSGFEVLGVGFLFPALSIIADQNFISKFPEIELFLIRIGIITHLDLIILCVFSLIAIYVLKNTYLGFMAWFQARYLYGLKAYFSNALFERYLSETYEFHLQKNTSLLLRNISTEMNVLVTNVLNPILLLITELTVFAGLAILLFILEPIGSLILFSVVLAAIYLFQRLTKGWLKVWGGKRQKYEGLRIQAANEGLGGIKDAKLLGREAEFKSRYLKWVTLSMDAQYKHAALDQMPRLWLETVGVIGLMLLTVSVVLRTGDTNQIVPVIGAFAAAAFRVLPSANRALSAITSLRYAVPAINIIKKDLADKSADVVGEKVGLELAFCLEIQLDDVCYSYPNSYKTALSSVNIFIKKNDTVGIIGASGAGKSTLIDVILGLLKPTSGRVLVDGVDIQTSLRGWQNKVGYVPQEIYLTDDTLRRNVAFGLPDELIDEKLLESSLNSSKLAEFVETLPNGIETLMGERGIRLSGGQKQRIGIARALYHNPSVLVFDEAMSALDSDTEAEVMGAINLLRGSRTIIIIAHRLSTVQNCDRVYEVENGHVSYCIAPKINSSV